MRDNITSAEIIEIKIDFHSIGVPEHNVSYIGFKFISLAQLMGWVKVVIDDGFSANE